MKKVRNIKERICALILAVLLPLTSVLPGAAVTVQAAEEEKTVSFYVYEEYTDAQSQEQKLPIKEAEIKVYAAGHEESPVYTGKTNEQGKIDDAKIKIDDTTDYYYSVVKTGYKKFTSSDKIDWPSLTSPVEVPMDMEEIQLSSSSLELNLDSSTENVKTVSIQNAVDTQGLSYEWTSNDLTKASVDSNGKITAVGRGTTQVTVSRNEETKNITVIVREELGSMSISVAPGTAETDNTVDVNSVNISVSGMENAKGDVQIYKSGESQAIGTIKSPYTDTVNYNKADALKGKVTFTAKYTPNADDYYYEKSVSTKEITYKKTAPLTLSDYSQNVIYGSEVENITAGNNSDNGRTLSFSSSADDVATAAWDAAEKAGVITVKKVGTTNITVSANENDEYTSATANGGYVLNVRAKDIEIAAEQITWDPLTKVYNGQNEIIVTGKVTKDKNDALVSDDIIIVTAKIELDSADKGTYRSGMLVSIDTTDKEETAANGNYNISLDSSLTERVTINNLDITVNQRPVYIQINKINNPQDSSVVDYGISNDDIFAEIKDDYEIGLVGNNGQSDASKEEGLVGDDTLNLTEYAKISLVDQKYYVGDYTNILQLERTKSDAGNYEIMITQNASTGGSLKVNPQTVADSYITDLLTVVEDAGVYNAEDSIYVRKDIGNLAFKFAGNAYYDQLIVNDGTRDYIFGKDGGSAIQFSEEGEKELQISLKNTEDSQGKTITASDNKLTITVDGTNPTVEFSGLGCAGIYTNPSIGFQYFANSDYDVTITPTEEGSGLALFQTKMITIDDDSTMLSDVEAAAVASEGWTDQNAAAGAVTITSSGNHIVLAKVRDHVGNEAVYTSNGLVFETNKPLITIRRDEIIDLNDNDSLNFYVDINDRGEENSELTSGIKEVEILVTDNGRKVEGEDTLNSEGKVIDSYTLTADDIKQLCNISSEDKEGTLAYLLKQAQFTIEGMLSVNKYHTGNIVITVNVTDNAGNTITEVSQPFSLDTKAPVVTVSYDPEETINGKYVSSRQMDVVFTERNFSEDGVFFDVAVNGEEQTGANENKMLTIAELDAIEGISIEHTDSEEELQQDEYSDERTNTYTIKVANDGAYSIIPYVTDTAGNANDGITYTQENDGNEEFIIDSKNPEVRVSYDNYDAQNGSYFQSRTMEVQFTERNFSESLISFDVEVNGQQITGTAEDNRLTLDELKAVEQIDGKHITVVDSESTETDEASHTEGRTITYTIPFKDGYFKVIPYIKDLAGHENEGITYADSDSTVNEEFCVDSKLPVIKVTYNDEDLTVSNDKYFKDQRVMTITYGERNFAEDFLNFDVVVDGTEHNGINLEELEELAAEADIQVAQITDSEGAVENKEYTDVRENTLVLTFGNKDKDHDYKIVPYVTDLAGNKNDGLTDENSPAVKTGEEFTVDMVDPVISLNYVKDNLENGSAANITTDSDVSSWYYSNTVVFGTAIITERNFALNENSFAQDQMNLSYTATDADGADVETNNYTDNAGTRNNWTAGDGNEKIQVFEFIEDANYTFGLTYTDLAGNQAVYDTHYFTVDKTAPTGTIKVSGSDPEGKESSLIEKLGQILFGFFRNEETTITFESDDTTSLYTQKYAIYDPEDIIDASTNTPQLKPTEDEETLEGILAAEWVGSDEFTRSIAAQEYKTQADSEQIPYMRLEDKAGNVAFYSTEGVIDDRTDSDPEIEITTIDPSTGTTDAGKEIFDGDVAFAISVTDPETNGTYSGLHSVSYRVLKDGETTQDYVYYEESVAELQAKDRVQSIEWNQETADKPIVDAELNNSNDVVIEVTAEDNSGNVTVVTRELAIDITDPRIDVQYDNNDVRNGKYFKEDRIMTVTYTERNFFEEGLTFDVTRDGTTQNGISLATLKTLDGIIVESGPADSQDEYAFKELKDDRTVQYTIRFDGGTSEDMDYAISLHIEDEAANTDNGVKYAENTKAAETFTVDKVAPLLNVVYRAGNSIIEPGLQKEPLVSENKDDITAAVMIEERNFSLTERFADGQMNLTYTAVDAYGETVGTSTDADAENPIENYTETANTRSEWQTGSDSGQYVRTHTFTFTKDANYTFALQYTDLAGNAAVDADDSTVTGHPAHYFTVDKTAPTGSIQIRESVWTRLFETVTFGFFTNSSDRVTFTSADKTADVATTQYYRYIPSTESRGRFSGLTVEELDRITDWRTAAPLTLNTEQQVIVYEKIVDRAGNVTYINSREGVVVDKTDADPEITITMADPVHGIYNSNVPFRISVTDPTSGGTYAGLKEVYYEVRRDGSVTQSGNYNSELTDWTQRRKSITKNEVVNAQLNNSNTVQIWVKAVDWAGNESEVTKDIKIDVTEPTIQVTYDLNSPLNDRYYNATRTATVVVTDRNFDESAVRFDITNTDGTQPSISGWSHSSNSGVSDEATHTCSVTFSADGDYTFTLNVTDLAGNDSHYTQVDDFTIDQTDPTIQVSYDNNNDAESGYYNEDRTATITVTEHNFNESEVNAQITARLQGSGVSAPGVGGWSTRGDVHTASVTFSSDADYTFDIDYTDLAGNAAADYTEDSFTIDQTAPEVEFFDIEDKSANKDTVAPGVRYSDVNYTSGGVDITIEGAIHPAEDVDGTRSNIANGESIKMADFAHTEENDDVYTMTAVITDRAGNETEESIVFSVNRFGSTYEFSPETKAFLEDHDPEDDYTYTNDPQDIVVTERNVDTLVFNGISYGRDGTQTDLEEGSDYTVRESGSEVSWKEYIYDISRNNFEEEGHYILNIDSEDRAENSMNNKVKGLDIEFTVDKTVPTLVITGVEEDSYRADTRDMTVNVADNTAVKEVQVLVDGEVAQTYDRSQIEQMGGELTYTIQNANSPRIISAVAVDLAGNETTYSLDHEVLVTSNLLIQYVNNTPLVVGSIIAVIVIAGAAYYFLIIAKRGKKGQEK